MTRMILVICGLLVSANSAFALSAADLYKQCTAAPGTDLDLLCQVWVTGYGAGLTDAQSLSSKTKTCIPVGEGGATPNQLRLIIEKFMRDYPQFLNESADLVAYEAISRAFPCHSPN